MAKKKVAAKKPAPKASRSPKSPSEEPAASARKLAKAGVKRQPQATGIHVYWHEIDGNSTNAPLVLDIPIAEGRGPNPPRPAIVDFTAEMSDEYWQDQFAFRVVSLEDNSVRVLVSRVDRARRNRAGASS